jgi:hypothetical protein
MIYFIIGYIIFLIAYIIFGFIAFYHLKRFGYKESASSLMLVLYPLLSIIIVVVTFVLLSFSGFSIPNDLGNLF